MGFLTRSQLSIAVGYALFAAACSAPSGGDDDAGMGGGSVAATGGGSTAAGGGSAPAGGGTSAAGGGTPATGGGSTATGGGSTAAGGGTVATGGGSASTDGGPTLAESMAAASTTASNHAACNKIRPFYWQIGDVDMERGEGTVGMLPDAGTYDGDSVMPIASASKWVYSTYFVQKTNGALTAQDIQFFNFWSGYTDFSSCPGLSTVSTCLDRVNTDGTTNGQLEPANVGKFFYSGGHMQKHASLNGLGSMARAALATEIRSQIGNEIALTYNEPQLAGGVVTSANEYAKMLRKIMGGQLVMGTVLGTHPVCTDPKTCSLALSSPLSVGPRELQYHYSIGHWVEDDSTGDGAFSSAGSFGFYPWINSKKTLYGVVARQDDPGSGFDSVECGQKIRTAWVSGMAQ